MRIQIIKRGESISVPSIEKDQTVGGYRRKPAPSDGIAVDGPDGFITKEQLEEALRALGKR